MISSLLNYITESYTELSKIKFPPIKEVISISSMIGLVVFGFGIFFVCVDWFSNLAIYSWFYGL